jgi:hypothetical protein
MGFFNVYLLGYIFITVLVWHFGYGNKAKWQDNEDWIYFVLLTLFAVLGGLMTMCVMKIALLIAGALFAYVIALLILTIGLGIMSAAKLLRNCCLSKCGSTCHV